MESLNFWPRSQGLGNYSIRGPGADGWGELYRRAPPRVHSGKQVLNLFGSDLAVESTMHSRSCFTDPQRRVDRFTDWVANAHEFVHAVLLCHPPLFFFQTL